MTVDTKLYEHEDVTETTTRPTSVPVEKVLDGIRRDSRENPDSYLEETEVPHGGE